MAFETAKWIWTDKTGTADEYAEFYAEFTAKDAPALLRLSCDGDYTAFLNGKFLASNQYGDFEHYKIFDEIDLTDFLVKGKNKLAVLVWHFGAPSSRYCPAMAGLIFEIVTKRAVLAASSETTLSRRSRAYKSGERKEITPQLGFSYCYRADREDGWQKGELTGFSPSVVVEKHCVFYRRPVEKLALGQFRAGKMIFSDGKRFVFDLGKESVGIFSIQAESQTKQSLLISYGEHLQKGRVPRFIGRRDFSFEYVCKAGRNIYTNYMLRLGCRFFEITCESELKNLSAGLILQEYPVAAVNIMCYNKADESIYNLCLDTLKNCMGEHYNDCPWREQCLYVYDSRVQMRCGYVAFENKNAAYARANLALIARDARTDGLLSICYPCGIPLAIPSFSLHYVLAVWEYVQNTDDLSLAEEVFCKLTSVLSVFAERIENGLCPRFEGSTYWNFYDWTDGACGTLGSSEKAVPDSLLNSLLILALEAYENICISIKKDNGFTGLTQTLRCAVEEHFYDETGGVCYVTKEGRERLQLANALAVLAGVGGEHGAIELCEELVHGDLIPCTLGSNMIKYDALLKTSFDYRQEIIREIRLNYGNMMRAGATSAWETMMGAEDFEGAGSLCHGWSAVPVYYYHLFGIVKDKRGKNGK